MNFAQIKARAAFWYDTHIVKGWYKTWTVWLSIIALVGPDLLQVALDNADTFFSAIPLLSDSSKAQLRILFLIVIPVVRAIKQRNLPAPVEPQKVEPAVVAEEPDTPEDIAAKKKLEQIQTETGML